MSKAREAANQVSGTGLKGNYRKRLIDRHEDKLNNVTFENQYEVKQQILEEERGILGPIGIIVVWIALQIFIENVIRRILQG